MDSGISLQRFTDLNQLFVDAQSQVDEDPFTTSKLAGPATASTEPFVANLVSELSRGLTTLFEQFYCMHPSLSI